MASETSWRTVGHFFAWLSLTLDSKDPFLIKTEMVSNTIVTITCTETQHLLVDYVSPIKYIRDACRFAPAYSHRLCHI